MLTLDSAFVVNVAAISISICGLLYHLLQPKPLPGIPHGPVGWFWGDLKGLVEASGNGVGETTFFSRHAQKYGPICQLILGPFMPSVLVSDPKEIEDIAKRRGADFEHSDRFHVTVSYTIPKGQISLHDGPMWRSHRRLMGPSMSPRYLALMSDRIRGNIANLLDLWSAKHNLLESMEKSAFNAKGDMQLYTMDTMGDISFAENFGGVLSALKLIQSSELTPVLNNHNAVDFPFPNVRQHKAVRLLFTVMGQAVSGPLPRLTYYLNGYWNAEWREARKYLHDLVGSKIEVYRDTFKERLKGDNGERADSVLEMIFEREGKDGPDVMPDDEIVDEMLLFLLAGQETTAGAFCWGLKYLTDNPRVQIKLHAELLHAFGTPAGCSLIPSYEQIQSGRAPYLDAVVAEILRLGGVAPLLCRQAKRDTHILGHFIPKGTEVMLLSHHTGLHDTVANQHIYAALDPLRSVDPKEGTSAPPWIDDGLSFIPERWIDADGRFNSRAGPSYPFGIGPRACFGSKLAMHQLKLGFASLNLAFFFDHLPHVELEGHTVKEAFTRPPIKAWVNLKKWATE